MPSTRVFAAMPWTRHQAPEAGDGDLPRGLVVDHNAALAGRAATGDNAIFAEQRFACPFAGQMPVGVGQAQARVRDDAVELRHQGGLGQDRQLDAA